MTPSTLTQTVELHESTKELSRNAEFSTNFPHKTSHDTKTKLSLTRNSVKPKTIQNLNDSKLSNGIHAIPENTRFENGESPSILSNNVYDEALSRQKESEYMKPIRNWERKMGFITPVIWSNAIAITVLHFIIVPWSLAEILIISPPAWQTILFSVLIGRVAGFGVTAGVHRLWCHRAYKATKPLKILLLICYSIAGQNTVFNWVRDHRVHHKFSETSADPHDSARGLFFSHVGWLMLKKHPDVIRAGAKTDLRDISEDPLLQFHTRYFTVCKLLLCFVAPMLMVRVVIGDSWSAALSSQLIRYVLTLHSTWAVNSFAHLYGNKPYDQHIMPSENLAVSIAAMGEGWHNYHHTFPWDYKASELGVTFNSTTVVLDYFARIGWAYDLKEASPGLVKAVAERKGDGTALRNEHTLHAH